MTKTHYGVSYAYVNLAALTLKVCYQNNGKIKVKYQDDMGAAYMVDVATVRLYQDPRVRDSDVLRLTRKNFRSGYTYRVPDPNKSRRPSTTGHWNTFPVDGHTNVDENGDLAMAFTKGGDTVETTFDEHNAAKYGPAMYKDLEVGVDTMVEWWEPIAEAYASLSEWLLAKGLPVLPTAPRCVLSTCTPVNLGDSTTSFSGMATCPRRIGRNSDQERPGTKSRKTSRAQ